MRDKSALAVRFIFAERKLIYAANLEILRYVEARSCSVSIQHRSVVEKKRGAAIVIGHVDRFRIGVSAFDQQAGCETAVDGDLKSVVVGTQPAIFEECRN